jgi:hypothetical protein
MVEVSIRRHLRLARIDTWKSHEEVWYSIEGALLEVESRTSLLFLVSPEAGGGLRRPELAANAKAHQPLILWSTGRELNPRILVLQTSALATSPPVLFSSLCEQSQWRDRPHSAFYLP